MDKIRKRVEAILPLYESDLNELSIRMGISLEHLQDILNEPENNMTEEEVMNMAAILGVSRNHLLGMDIFNPQINLSCDKTFNGFWGAIAVQTAPDEPFMVKPITMANLIFIKMQLSVFKNSPGVVVFPCLDNSVVFLRTDRICQMEFFNASTPIYKSNSVCTKDITEAVEQYPLTSLLPLYEQRVNTGEEYDPGDYGPAGVKTFMNISEMDENQLKNFRGQHYCVHFTDASMLNIPMELAESDDVLEFCQRNMSFVEKQFTTVTPWDENHQVRIPGMKDDVVSTYKYFWPFMLNYVYHDFATGNKCNAVLNMNNVTMIELYIPDLEEAMYIHDQKAKQ